MIDDMYSLLSWCEGKSLDAHVSAYKCAAEDNELEQIHFEAIEDTFNEVIAKIRNNQNQRPHVKEGSV